MRKALGAVPVCLILMLSGEAAAGVTVLGGGQARQCYIDAERERANDIAVDNCTRALETEPLDQEEIVATLGNRGILKMQLGRIPAAIIDFDRAIALDAGEPEAYLNKAVALFRSEGRWREAMPLFTLALEKNTRKPEIAYFGRGLSNELAGDLRAAYADLKRANALAPEWDQPAKELQRYAVKPKRG